jgi:uncharacterized protein (DUF924 family)
MGWDGMTKTVTVDDVLAFWFDEILPESWFSKDPSFDTLVDARFGQAVAQALAGKLDHWANDARGCLALILLLDQFTRNIYRDTPRAFTGDEMALALSLRCVERGYIHDSLETWCQFMLMPMMHSEDITIQDRSLPLFKAHTGEMTYDYAVRHHEIVARFGRFPHRNHVLGRPSSDEEQTFLADHKSPF